jgi:hypothetical protein
MSRASWILACNQIAQSEISGDCDWYKNRIYGRQWETHSECVDTQTDRGQELSSRTPVQWVVRIVAWSGNENNIVLLTLRVLHIQRPYRYLGSVRWQRQLNVVIFGEY